MRLFRRFIVAVALVASAACVAGSFGITSAQALDRKVEVVNKSVFPLKNLYGMRADNATWKFNYLPTSSTLPAGASRTFDFDDKVTGPGSCMRDLLFDLPGYGLGSGILKLEGVNVCKIAQLTIINCPKPGGYCILAK